MSAWKTPLRLRSTERVVTERGTKGRAWPNEGGGGSYGHQKRKNEFAFLRAAAMKTHQGRVRKFFCAMPGAKTRAALSVRLCMRRAGVIPMPAREAKEREISCRSSLSSLVWQAWAGARGESTPITHTYIATTRARESWASALLFARYKFINFLCKSRSVFLNTSFGREAIL